MADDIVERLRNGTPTAVYVIANDAADEIERLRAERTSLLSAGLAFQAEAERLRALGDELDEALTWDQSCPYDAATTRAVIKQRRLAWQEARRER